MKTTDSAVIERIYLAGGCFWGIQHLLKQLHGLRSVTAGYVNSDVANPTYEMVKSGKTGAAEAVCVEYNATVVDLEKLLTFFLESIDLTTKDAQGPDHGTQYRSGIYYTTDSQKEVAYRLLHKMQEKEKHAIVTELLPEKNFTPAEDFHQDYLDKTPDGYCHISKGRVEAARGHNILKPGAPTDAAHGDANYANEAKHAPAHGQPYENDAVYPDTRYVNTPGK